MDDTKDLVERLEGYPQLKGIIRAILDKADGSIERADDVEEQLIGDVRELGQQVLQDWAVSREKAASRSLRKSEEEVVGNGKKKVHWNTSFGEISVMEQTVKVDGGVVRPFCEATGVQCRGYSLPYQRRITDFGSQKSFDRGARQVKEHYGLDISESTVRRITEGHGKRLLDHPELVQGKPNEARGAEQLIAETDGTMIPIVTVDSNCEGDQRKTRQVAWKEGRLSLVYEQGTVDPIFAATATGSTDYVGDQLADCASAIGIDVQTQVHAVGDGATWIPDQMDRAFGAQSSFLIDFYHLSDYLAAASKSCAADHRAWLKEQQERMKTGQKDAVVAALEVHLEPSSVKDKDAPVRACLRYIKNRPGQFDYPEAILAELPIGSGKIESAHRYVIQERMKITGAWWKLENADSMLALRAMRANERWDDYWSFCAKQHESPAL